MVEGLDLDLVPLAAGKELHPLVAHWQERATVLRLPYEGGAPSSGALVIHCWAKSPNSANSANSASRSPVVLLHGGAGSWTHWVANLETLTEAGHDVWAIDMPGFGASDPLPDQQDVDTMLPVLTQALERCGKGKAMQIMGFSLGGMTAGLLAEHSPHLVSQVVLVGAPGLGLRDKPIYRLQGWRHLTDPREQLERHAHNLGALMFADKSKIDRSTLALHTSNVWRDRLPRRRLSSTDILRQTLPRLRCTVHAIYGEHDVIYRGLWAEAQQCLERHSVHFGGFHLLRGAGHWVQYEQPEEFARLALPLLI